MKTRAQLERLFQYDAWANREVLTALRRAKVRPGKALKIMAHILAAGHLWLSRLLQDGEKVAVWPDLSLEECEAKAEWVASFWRKYFGGLTDAQLAQSVDYTNSKGESWTSARGDILLHVVMHSAYHRGQIATDMRAAGLEPAYTDFIHAVRQGRVAE